MARFVFYDTPEELVTPILALKAEVAALEFQRATYRLLDVLVKHNFNPAQPRVPAGSADGGQWTDTGGGSGGYVRVALNDRGPGATVSDAGGGLVRVAAADEDESTRGLFEEFLDPLAETRQQAFASGIRSLRRLEPSNFKVNTITDASRPYVPTPEALDDLNQEIEAAQARVARRISSGHALGKHAAEFGYPRQADLEEIVIQVLRHASRIVDLPRGRTGYYGRRENTLVITNPADSHGGTVMKPRGGEGYLDKLERDQ